MGLSEPTTALTDLLLALLALGFALQLTPYSRRLRQESIRDWGLAFGALSVGALAGGVSHGFAAHLNPAAYAVVWRITLYSIGFASYYMVAGTARAALRHRVASWLIVVAAVKLAGYLYWTTVRPEFRMAVYDYVPGMAAVLVMGMMLKRRRRESAGSWLAAGVVVSFLAAGVQLSGLTLAENFNHNDLYHVIQMAALVLFYRGASRLQDIR
jgi:hypothetical protein